MSNVAVWHFTLARVPIHTLLQMVVVMHRKLWDKNQEEATCALGMKMATFLQHVVFFLRVLSKINYNGRSPCVNLSSVLLCGACARYAYSACGHKFWATCRRLHNDLWPSWIWVDNNIHVPQTKADPCGWQKYEFDFLMDMYVMMF